MGLRYRLLGPLDVDRDGTALDLGGPKQRSVLACLLLERNRVVATDRLVDVLWGEDAPPSALPSLQVYVSNLRRLLRDPETGVPPLQRQAPGYLLVTSGGEVDLDRALELSAQARELIGHHDWREGERVATEAAALWRGPLLADLGGPDWLRAESQSWADRRSEVQVAQVTAQLGGGRLVEAVAAARALTVAHPLSDDACRLLVLALHRSGRTAEALDAYTQHGERLADELGIDPSPGLQETHVALLRQEPWALHWPVDERTPTSSDHSEPGPGVPTAATSTEQQPFVGRQAQLAESAQLIADVLAGRPRWVVLTGPAGIGKTRLAEEILSEVERSGGRCVRGRCLEEEGAPAWWPMRQVVRDLGADPDSVLTAPDDADADRARFAVYERVHALLVEASTDRPIAVLVDDLQWADATSRSCLTSLASSLTTGRVLFVATVRDVEGGAAVRRTTASLARSDGSRHIVVPPLDQRDVATLAGQVAGTPLDDRQARLLTDHTGGNALFVTEYARLAPEARLEGEAPLAVRAVLGRRLEGLDTAVLQVLRAAAVLGDVVQVDLLAAVTRLDREDLVDLLDDAADEHIIAARPGSGYGFSHALLRDEVLAGISPVRTQRLHATAAAALATAGGERVTQRAQHLVAAGPLAEPRDVLEACRAAALQAEERWSSETAVGWWRSAREALDLLPADEQDLQERDDLIVSEVEALARAGHGQTLLGVVDAGILEAQRTGRPETAGRLAGALMRAAGSWPWIAFGPESVPLLTHLSGLSSFVEHDVATRARVRAALAVGSCYSEDPAVPDELSRSALVDAESTGDPDVMADALLGRILAYVGVASHVEECDELVDRLMALPRVEGRVDEVIAHTVSTMSRTIRGDVAGGMEHLRLGTAGADLLRLPTVRVQLRWMECGVAHWLSGAEAALPKQAEAEEAHARVELYKQGFETTALLFLHWDLGTVAEVAIPDDFDFEVSIWQAVRAAARGDRTEAEKHIAGRLAEPGPVVWWTLAHEALLAHTVADLELVEHADELLRRLTPHSGRLAMVGQGPIAGPVDLALARLHLLSGDTVEARRLAATARDLATETGSRRWAARCADLLAEVERG